MKIRNLILAGTAVVMTACQPELNKDMEQKIDELYQRMTQEERIAQLRSCYMDDLFDEQGQLDTMKCKELIPNGIGHFSQYASQKPMDPNVLRDRVARPCGRRSGVADDAYAERHSRAVSRGGAVGHQHPRCDDLSAADRAGLFV